MGKRSQKNCRIAMTAKSRCSSSHAVGGQRTTGCAGVAGQQRSEQEGSRHLLCYRLSISIFFNIFVLF